jgi:hypothetical protein
MTTTFVPVELAEVESALSDALMLLADLLPGESAFRVDCAQNTVHKLAFVLPETHPYRRAILDVEEALDDQSPVEAKQQVERLSDEFLRYVSGD